MSLFDKDVTVGKKLTANWLCLVIDGYHVGSPIAQPRFSSRNWQLEAPEKLSSVEFSNGYQRLCDVGTYHPELAMECLDMVPSVPK